MNLTNDDDDDDNNNDNNNNINNNNNNNNNNDNKQRQVKQLPLTANQILKKWKNIPDIVYSVNKTIRQQLLPTKTYSAKQSTDDHHRHQL